ncbi:unnamed protein product [Symbiodinium natans]|uniref:Uncharacterized protein n=1 Tax=Symbiodinium natans TaxID=878477 RepID=A0A812V5K2_9DINO|nr:unnamed protein product [Symbiodinium natans]
MQNQTTTAGSCMIFVRRSTCHQRRPRARLYGPLAEEVTVSLPMFSKSTKRTRKPGRIWPEPYTCKRPVV